MIKAPPTRKLENLMLKKVTLTKYVMSGGTDAYGQQERTGTSYTLKAEIQEITAENLSFFKPGTVDVGDAWGYFQPSYTVKGLTITISPEDEVTWNGKTWRIDFIEDAYIGESLWYRRAFLKRVV